MLIFATAMGGKHLLLRLQLLYDYENKDNNKEST